MDKITTSPFSIPSANSVFNSFNLVLSFSSTYKILTEQINFPPQDIIFDSNVLTIGTGIEEHNNYAVDFIDSVRWIKENLPHSQLTVFANSYVKDILDRINYIDNLFRIINLIE